MACEGVTAHEGVKQTVRVMVVAENRFGAVLLREVLSQFPCCNVVSSVASCEQALASASSTPADVAVINQDVEGQPLRGLQVTKLLASSFPCIKPVIMITSATFEVIAESFQSGARGILHDGEQVDALWDCISQVHHGQIYASQADISYLVEALVESPPLRLLDAQGKATLTKREQLIAHHVTQGHTNREIAGKLGLSEHTIKNYLFRIFEKLEVSSRAEMIFYVLRCRTQASQQANLDAASSNASPLSAYFKEAQAGCANAQCRLGESYSRGEGVPKDAVTAYMWLTLAEESAASTLESAKIAKERLVTKLTRSDIAAAQIRAIKFRSKNSPDPKNAAGGHPRSIGASDTHLDLHPADERTLPLSHGNGMNVASRTAHRNSSRG